MNVFVAYSKPRGKYGRYIFTVMIYFSYPTESAKIAVMREEMIYSCEYCGKWASITISQPLPASQHERQGVLELFRYDRIDPEDEIELVLRDPEMVSFQLSKIRVGQNNLSVDSYWQYPRFDRLRERDNYEQKRKEYEELKRKAKNYAEWNYHIEQYYHEYQEQDRKETLMNGEVLYEVILLDWDAYPKSATLRVEEELIQKTMNAEKITIQELQLEPASQLPTIQGQQQFIEGELRYLTD